MAVIIDGKKVSAELREQIKNEAEEFFEKYGVRPGLAVIIVGDDPASKVYVNNKEKACAQVGYYSEVYRLPEGNDNPLRGIHHFVLGQLVLNQCNGQSGSVYRDIYLLQNVRKCADVILMSMRDDKALDLVDVVLQIRDIRYHAVNTEHIVLRECQSAVNDYDRVLILYRSDIHSNLFQTAQRNDLQA